MMVVMTMTAELTRSPSPLLECPPFMNDRFLKACRREPVDCTPVWFMRQAGRYMKEYQAVRATRSILDVCKTPELAAQVTLQPIDRFALDAAIIFADILLPLEAMGLNLEFTEGEGPVIANPVRSRAAVDRLMSIDGDELRYVSDAIRQARRALADRVPLIGFAGAPFTLASYAIEGGGSRNYIETKSMMYREPEAWHRLMDKLARVVTGYLRQQIQAGAQAIQLFDSWVGCLSPGDYAEYVLPHVQLIFEGLRREGVPLIYFGTGTATLLPLMRKAGATCWAWIGGYTSTKRGPRSDMTWRFRATSIRWYCSRRNMKLSAASTIFFDGPVVVTGHIFNLGHGILPNTPVEDVAATVDLVHKLSQGKIQNLKIHNIGPPFLCIVTCDHMLISISAILTSCALGGPDRCRKCRGHISWTCEEDGRRLPNSSKRYKSDTGRRAENPRSLRLCARSPFCLSRS